MPLCEDHAYVILGTGWGRERHDLNRVVQTLRNLSFLQTTEFKNKLWRIFQLDSLFPSLGFLLLLQLVSGIWALEQPCCYYSQSFPPSRVCVALPVFWNQCRESNDLWLYVVKMGASETSLSCRNCNRNSLRMLQTINAFQVAWRICYRKYLAFSNEC